MKTCTIYHIDASTDDQAPCIYVARIYEAKISVTRRGGKHKTATPALWIRNSFHVDRIKRMIEQGEFAYAWSTIGTRIDDDYLQELESI